MIKILYKTQVYCFICCLLLPFSAHTQSIQLEINANQYAVLDEAKILESNLIDACLIDNPAIPIGGSISFADGTTELSICAPDRLDNSSNIILENATGLSFWIMTDIDGTIIFITTDDPNEINFDEIVSGQFQIWHGSYIDVLSGVTIGESINGIDGCVDLSNPITVNATFPDGGSVMGFVTNDTLSIDTFATKFTVCVGDGIPDFLTFKNTSIGNSDYSYIFTTANNEFITATSSSIVDVENLATGNCKIYGVSHPNVSFNDFNIQNGDNVTQAQIADCFDLSDNFIELIRVAGNDCTNTNTCLADGGSIFTDMMATVITVCVDDGNPDVFTLLNSSSANSSYSYIITNPSNEFLAVTNSGNLDVTNIGEGNCRIYGVSHPNASLNDLNIQNLEDITQAQIADCFDLSDNYIELFRVAGNDCSNTNTCLADGGSVFTEMMATVITVCVGDGNPDIITMLNSSSTNSSYSYLFTNPSNEFLAVTNSGSLDVENIGEGNCRIYGVSHPNVSSNDLNIQFQQDVTQTQIAECFDLSDNFIELIRVFANDCTDTGICLAYGGVLSANGSQSTISVCIGDGVADQIQLDVNNSFGAGGIFLITDDQGTILNITINKSIDLDTANPMIGYIYHIAAIGDTGAATNQNISDLQGCFSLSNPIQVINTCANLSSSTRNSLTQLSLNKQSSCDLSYSITIPQDTFYCNDLGVQLIDVEVLQLGTTFTCTIEVDIQDPNNNCVEAVESIPTMGQWGLINLTLLLFIFGVSGIRVGELNTQESMAQSVYQ